MSKVTVVGAGNVGATCANVLAFNLLFFSIECVKFLLHLFIHKQRCQEYKYVCLK